MSKIVITVEDDPISGAVVYKCECGDYTFKNGEPSAALLVAQSIVEFLEKAFQPEKQN